MLLAVVKPSRISTNRDSLLSFANQTLPSTFIDVAIFFGTLTCSGNDVIA
jgi:hypothetical protein